MNSVFKVTDSLKNTNNQREQNNKENIVEGEYRIINENKDAD